MINQPHIPLRIFKQISGTAAAAVDAAEAALQLQYMQGTAIRTQDSVTADRCATNELHSPLLQCRAGPLNLREIAFRFLALLCAALEKPLPAPFGPPF